MGNQMWNIAAMIGFSKKYGVLLNMPDWHYAKYFKKVPGNGCPIGAQVAEKEFHYTPEYYDSLDWSKDMDFLGYFQSPRYWEHCKDDVVEAFEFDDDFKKHVRIKYSEVFKKKTIAISCRVGDYVGNPGYEVLPAMYYILSLYTHFEDWKDYNLIFLSDSIDWAKLHFGCLSNAYFATDFDDKNYFFSETAVEQLCLMSMADHFIIANSTFSEWGAILGEKEGSKVIRPAHYLAGKLKEKCDMKDHYPTHWVEFNHKGKKFDLTDVTFTIPVYKDHNDRKENIDLSVCMIQRDFDTNVIVGEQGGEKFAYFRQWCRYEKIDMKFFWRTKMLNLMARMADTEIVVNFDCDCVIPPMQIILSVEAIRSGEADFVFPYDGRFLRLPRNPWFKTLERHLDAGVIAGRDFNGGRPGDATSVGGCVFVNKEKFFEAGGENENFKNYGCEDVERVFRWNKLGYKVKRIVGVLLHIDHFIGPNSSNRHQYHENNKEAWIKINSFDADGLRNFVDSWEWAK